MSLVAESAFAQKLGDRLMLHGSDRCNGHPKTACGPVLVAISLLFGSEGEGVDPEQEAQPTIPRRKMTSLGKFVSRSEPRIGRNFQSGVAVYSTMP